MFYLFTATGLIINLLCAPITISEIVTILHYIVVYFIILSTIFLLVFILTFLRTEEVFGTKKQLTIIIIFALPTSVIFFIPDGVEINENTGWNPHWSWSLFIYVFILIVTIFYLPSLYYFIKLYQKFEDDLLRKKWMLFIIGLTKLIIVVLGTFLIHAINNPLLRTIFTPISLILSVSGAYLLYYGYAKKFKSK